MTVIKDAESVQHENEVESIRKEVRSMAARQDIDGLTSLPKETLEVQRGEANERLETRSNRRQDEDRPYTDREEQLSKADMAEIEAIDAALVLQERKGAQAAHSKEILQALADVTDTRRQSNRHPSLLVSEANLRKHAEAIRAGSSFGAVEELQTRATVTVATDYGSEGSYDIPGLRESIPLRAFAGITSIELTGATAQMPSLTLPTGVAGVAEGTASAEYDTVDVVNLTALRYGRWTKVTSFVNEFDQLRAINQAHAIAIARDLNLLDLTAIQTAAGSVTAFASGAEDKNVRAAILKVAGATLCNPEDVVLFGTSAALAIVNGFAPANADDRGSSTVRVFGARTYVTEQATAGNVYAFYPGAFQVFQTRLRSAATLEPSDGSNKFGSWLTSTGPGLFIAGGAAGVDVVTP